MSRRWRSRAARAFDLARAELALGIARMAAGLLPSGRLLCWDATVTPTPGAAAVNQAKRLASAVDRACELGPIRGTCLVRAVALQRLMKASGLEGSRIRIGVRPSQHGQIAAHAWVEYGEHNLGFDGARADEFLPFSGGAVDHLLSAVR